MKRKICILLASWTLATAGMVSILPSAAAAEIHALLIGVAAYPFLPPQEQLAGPVYDVRALTGLLIDSWGVDPKNIVSLTDRQASREAILKSLADLAGRSKAGDSIFVYFSGHGTSAYAPKSNIFNIDPYSGALIPADFRKGSPVAMRQSLIIGSRDLQPIFKSLEKDRQVFVAFDSCYSGFAVRSITRGVTARKPKDIVLDWEDQEKGGASAQVFSAQPATPYPYRNVVYLAAASPREVAYDVAEAGTGAENYQTFDGRPHGAFTDALLRGMAGAADSDRDNRITYVELYQYTRGWVSRNFTQTPQILRPEDNSAIVTKPIFDRVVKPALVRLPIRDAGLRVRMDGVEDSLKQRIGHIDGLKIADNEYDLLLLKEGDNYRLYLANGFPLISYSSRDQAKLIDRLARQVLLDKLIALNYPDQDFNLSLGLIDPRGVLLQGEKVGFDIRTEAEAYVLLVDIDTSGVINVIYPGNAGELSALKAGQGHRLENIGEVVPAFGTDYVKLFAFKERPAGLERLMGKSFSPTDPLFDELWRMVGVKGKGVAQECLQVKTAAKADMVLN